MPRVLGEVGLTPTPDHLFLDQDGIPTNGVIAGLAEAGIDVTEAADLVIGTSSGANVETHVRSGIPPAELLASILSEQVRPIGQNRQPPPSVPMAKVFERMRTISAAETSAAEPQRAMGAYGLESDATFGPKVAEQRWTLVAARLPSLEWPVRPRSWWLLTPRPGH